MTTLEREYWDLLSRFGVTCDDPQGAMMSDEELTEAVRLAAAAAGHNVVAGMTVDDVKKALSPLMAQGTVYTAMLSEIVQAAREHNVQSSVDVWAGRFPTGALNAQAVRVTSGILLLLNTGLEDWLHRITNTYLSSVAFTIGGASGTLCEVPRKPEDEVIREVAALVREYLVAHGVSHHPIFSLDAGARGMLTFHMSDAAITFALAHEYGHAVAGHLTDGQAVRRSVVQSEGTLEYIEKSWEQEYEADALGMAFLLPPSRIEIASRDDFILAATRANGPFLLLGLALLVEEIVSALEGTEERTVIVSDHPPTTMRIERLQNTWDHLVSTAQSPMLADTDVALFPEGIVSWFKRITPAVSQLVTNAFAGRRE